MRVYAYAIAFFISAAILGVSQSASAQETVSQNANQKQVIVQKGDSLIKIAEREGTSYERLFYANEEIKDPDLIYPDQVLRVPADDEVLTERPIPANAQVVQGSQPSKKKVSTPKATFSALGSVWDRLAACESGGNWSINTGNGYYGGLQFTLGTWQSNGGTGYPHLAPKAEQIRIAENLRAARGFSPWPACSLKLGLR